MAKKEKHKAPNANDIFGQQSQKKAKIKLKKPAKAAAPVKNTPQSTTAQQILNQLSQFVYNAGAGMFHPKRFYPGAILDIDNDDEISPLMTAQLRTDYQVIVKQTFHNPIVFACGNSFELRSYICALCRKPCVAWEVIENFNDDILELLAEGHDHHLGSCFCGAEIFIFNNSVERNPLPPSGLKTGTFEWNGLYFEAEDDTKCPICEAETKELKQDGQHYYQPNSNKLCPACGAKKIGSALVLWKEFRAAKKKEFYFQRWVGTYTVGFDEEEDMSGKTSITWDPQAKVYKVAFGYLRDKKQFDNMIELLKKQIPSSDRAWEPKLKLWFVSEQYLDVLKMICEAFFGKNIQVTEKSKIEELYENWEGNKYVEKPIIISDELSIFTKLIREAGLSIQDNETDGKVASKLYKRAIMFFHPDRNPEKATEASQLNAAWANLQSYFGLEKPKMEQQSE